ncbi:unnamed protein product, partial [Prunus brigantina]
STIPLLLPSHPHHLPNTIPLVQFPETTPSFTSPSSPKHNSSSPIPRNHSILHIPIISQTQFLHSHHSSPL